MDINRLHITVLIERLPCEIWLGILSLNYLTCRDLVAVEKSCSLFLQPQALLNGKCLTEEAARSIIRHQYKRYGKLCIKTNEFHSWKHLLYVLERIDSCTGYIAAGANQNMFITPNRSLLTWGSGRLGQLGNGVREDSSDAINITKHISKSDGSILQVAAGLAHSMVVTESGTAYTFGDGRYFQTGLANNHVILTPQPIVTMSNVRIIQVACGGSHSLFLTDEGEVFSCGKGLQGQLGHGDEINTVKHPTKLTLPTQDRLVHISASVAHNLLVTISGSVYGFGLRNHGALGLDDDNQNISQIYITKPILIPNLTNIKIADCGLSHSLCIDYKGRVYTFGQGRYGMLGHGDTFDRNTPKIVESLSDTCITSAEAGPLISIFVSKDGTVYWCGRGVGENEFNTCLPTVIRLDEKVIQATVGNSHILLLTRNFNIYSIGNNSNGQTGHDRGSMKIPKITQIDLKSNKR